MLSAAINGWNDHRQRQEAAAAIEGPAAQIVTDIDPEDAADIGEYLDECQGRYITGAATDMARISFSTAEQHAEETILAWHARCRALFIISRPQEADVENNRDLLDRFIIGLLNRQVATKTWERRPDTYAEALNDSTNAAAGILIFANRPTPGPQMKTEPGLLAMGQGQGRARGDAGRATGGRGRRNPPPPRGGPAAKRCWFCDSTEHLRDKCTLWVKAERSLGAKGDNLRKTMTGGRGGGTGRGRGFRPSGYRAVNAVEPPAEVVEEEEEGTEEGNY